MSPDCSPPLLTFSRAERLKSRKLISGLFKGGESLVAYPLRLVWTLLPEDASAASPAQISISVSKRLFKTAVARNRLKRQIREAYRLQKAGFYEKLADRRIALMLMYIAKEALPYAEIEGGVRKMIRKFPESTG
jgi:ribonuclease P protein component